MHQCLPPGVQTKASLTSLSATGAHHSSGHGDPPIRQAISFSTLNVSNCRKAAVAGEWGAGDALQKHRSLEFSSIPPEQLLLNLEPKGVGRRGPRGRPPLTRTASTPFVLAQQGAGWEWDGGAAEPVLPSQLPNACYSSFQVKKQDGFSPVELNLSSQEADSPPSHRNRGQCPYSHCCSAEDLYFSPLSPDDPTFAECLVEGQDALLSSCAAPAPLQHAVGSTPPPRPGFQHAAPRHDEWTSSPSKWCRT